MHHFNKGYISRIISILVCLAIVCGLIPISPLSAAAVAPNIVENPTPITEPQELIQYRTETSKRFLNPDGTLTEKIYIDPIHYKDTSGKWQDIDSTLVLASNGNYHNKSNRFNVELTPTANSGFFKYTQDGASLSFKPSFAGAANGGVKGHKIDYKDVTTDTDIRYEVQPNGLKETLVLKSAKVPKTFSFKLKMENLTYQSQPDGSVAFYKPGNKKPVFYLDSPFMVDANLNSTSAAYQFRKDSSGDTVLDIVIDPQWLSDPSRAYPVLLDPTIQLNSEVSDTFISSTNPNTNYGNWSHIYVGKGTSLGTTRSLYWFRLPSLPSSAYISSSTLTVTNTTIYVTGSPVVEAHRIIGDWNANTVNYANQPSIGSSEPPYTVSNTTTPYNWNIDVLNLVRAWYQEAQANYGVELKYTDENLTMRELDATDDTGGSHPCLTVNYEINPLGDEDFWTYAGDVNIANGNLVLSDSDLDVPGRGIPTTITRTYNSRSSNSTGNFGYGWNSELDVKILPVAKGPIAYFDADRTVHYFEQLSDGTYDSPPGLYLKLDKNGDGTYTISEKNGIKYKFLSNGYIYSITDAQGNILTYDYEPTKTRITSITDSSGRSTSIHYGTDNRVDTVTDYAGRQSSYGYSAAGDLILVTNAAGTADAITSNYKYDTNHNLISETDPKGNKTYYYYSVDDRIQSINPINKALNANFEVDSDANNIPDLWSLYTGQSGTCSLEAASDVPFGYKSFKVTAANTNTYNYSSYLTDPVPVDRTKAYTLSGSVKGLQSSGSQNTVLSLYAYNSSNQSLGEFARIDNAGTFAWKRIYTTLAANALPAGTAYVKIRVAASNATGSGTSWFDAAQFEEGSTQSDFVGTMTYTSYPAGLSSAFYDANGKKTLYTYNENADATSVSIDPAGLNYKTSYAWDTSNKRNDLTGMKDANTNASGGQVNNVTNTYVNGNLTQSDIDDGTPEKLTNTFTYTDNSDLATVQDGNANAGKYITQKFGYDDQRNPANSSNANSNFSNKAYSNGNLTNQTNSFGIGDNSLVNSSLERGSTWPDYWSTPTISGNATVTWDSTTSFSGKKGFTISNVIGTNPYVVIGNSYDIPISANDYLTLTGYAKATTTEAAKAAYLKIDAYDASGALLTNSYPEHARSNRIGIANQWNRLKLTVSKDTLPANTAKIRAAITVVATSGTVYFDNLQLEKNSFASGYNLLDNVSFENGSASPDYWTGSTFTRDTSAAYHGTKSMKVVNPASWALYAPNYFIPYDNSKGYTFGGFLKTSSLSSPSGTYYEIDCYDSNHTLIGNVQSNRLSKADNDWTYLEVYAAPGQLPTGTAYIKPALVSSPLTGTAYFDAVRLVEGKTDLTSYEYNQADGSGKGANNYITHIIDSLLHNRYFTYDTVGNILTSTDALNHTTSFIYDKLDQLKRVTMPSSIDLKTEYTYDVNGNRTQVINKKKDDTVYNTTSYSYNHLDLLTGITDPLNKITAYKYDAGGNLTSIEYPNNKKVGFSYNMANRLDKISFDGTTKYTLGYDPNGNRTSVQDNIAGRVWSYIYDKVDQLTKVTDPDNTTQENTYDKNGNRITQKVTASSIDYNYNYTYSKNDKLLQVKDIKNNSINTFSYDEQDNLAVIRSGNNTISDRQYNQNNWLTDILNAKADGNIFSSYNYDYYDNGNRKTVTDNTGKVITYTYDEANQLKSETDPLSTNTINYDYDGLGNRKTKTVKDSANNVISTISYNYNAADQLTTVNGQTYTYDEAGNLKDDGSKTYTWDAGGRLTEVRNKSDNSLIAQYEYDADGRRVKSAVSGVVTNYHYDGNSLQVLYETNGSGNLTTLYTYSANSLLLSMNKIGQGIYYYHYNGHGDVTQLTDQSGNIVASYT